MSSERQKQASRANGAKSRGPVTATGKFNSSQNAMKHGIFSGTAVFKCESPDRFLTLVNALLEEFQPQTPFEQSLIEDMALARWRRMRIRGLEKCAIDSEMQKQLDTGDPIAAQDSCTRAASAYRTLCGDSRYLEHLSRYDSRCHREYLRLHRSFIEARDRRTPPSAQPPQSAPAPQPAPEPVPAPPAPENAPAQPNRNTNIAERTRQLHANKTRKASARVNFIRVYRRLSAAKSGHSGHNSGAGR